MDGKTDEAEELFISILKRQTKVLGTNNTETWKTKDVLYNLALLQRDIPTAERILHEQIKHLEETRGDYHCHTLDRRSILGRMISSEYSNLEDNANVS